MRAPLHVSLPDQKLLDALAPTAGVEFFVWDFSGPAPAGRLDIVVPPYMRGPEVLAALESVDIGLVQSQSIGYDGVADVLPAGCVFANAAGVHETSTAELALGMMIASQRGMDDFVRNQASGTWDNSQRPSLADRRVLLVGVGGIGHEIARRLEPFEVTVTRVGSSARTDKHGEVHASSELTALAATHDILVTVLPLNEQTHQLIGEEVLAALPDGALVVNVGRGPVVDTAALTKEVLSGRLQCALDVVDPEPLPQDHALWSTPNALITPHVGGNASAFQPRILKLLRKQLEALAAGQAPANLVQNGPFS